MACLNKMSLANKMEASICHCTLLNTVGSTQIFSNVVFMGNSNTGLETNHSLLYTYMPSIMLNAGDIKI